MSDAFTIEVKFDYLDTLVKNLETIPVRKYLKAIMLSAKKIVIEAYAQGATDGNTEFTANVRTTKDTATLTVRGADVGFLEFGAGAMVQYNEFAEQVPYPVYTGTYSDAVHGMYQHTHHTFWFWINDGTKIKYTEIIATQGMQQALDDLRSNLVDEVRRRIASWIVNGK